MSHDYSDGDMKSLDVEPGEDAILVTGDDSDHVDEEGPSPRAPCPRARQSSRLHTKLSTTARVAIWSFCILTYTLLLSSFVSSRYSGSQCHDRDNHGLDNEGIYDDAPLEHQTIVTFKRAGFHDSRHNDLTPYEGEPNAQNNAAWDRLMRVGIITISSDENNRLQPSGTAKSTRDASRYVVELEMFHQLHCLKALRRQLWEFERGLVDGSAVLRGGGAARAQQRQQHFDHCIDYLRQAIMCHGDLTPNTFEWNDETQSYLAHHRTRHQCRDFERVYDWAAGRNTSGLIIDGDHQNVDLKKEEVSD